MLSCVTAAERGESAGGDKTEPQRLTDSVAPPEDGNEIAGGRTNAHKFPGEAAVYRSCAHI